MNHSELTERLLHFQHRLNMHYQEKHTLHVNESYVEWIEKNIDEIKELIHKIKPELRKVA